jgi:acetyl-CoA carboxylase alpha subunit
MYKFIPIILCFAFLMGCGGESPEAERKQQWTEKAQAQTEKIERLRSRQDRRDEELCDGLEPWQVEEVLRVNPTRLNKRNAEYYEVVCEEHVMPPTRG